MNIELAGNFFSAFDMKAFVMVQPTDGGDFVLEDYINAPGQVLEVAVRVPTVSEKSFRLDTMPFSVWCPPAGQHHGS